MKRPISLLDLVLCGIAMTVAALTIFCETGSPGGGEECDYNIIISNPSDGAVFDFGDAITFQCTLDLPRDFTGINWKIGSGILIGIGNPLIYDELDIGNHLITATASYPSYTICPDSVSISVVDSDDDPGLCTDDFNIISPNEGQVFDIGATITFEVTADPPVSNTSVSWQTETGGISTPIGTGNPLLDDTLETGNHTITATNLDSPECQDSVSMQVIDLNVPAAIVIPDTGLDAYYGNDYSTITEPGDGDDFYGQDFNYHDLLQYTSDAIGTILIVTDGVTSLIWQKEGPDAARNWQNAIDYCTNLEGDWRLPNLSELMTIVNYGLSSPAAFSEFDAKTGNYWSATESGSDPDSAWRLNFTIGVSSANLKTGTAYTRCIMDDPDTAFPELHQFVLADSEIVSDLTTGYQWHRDHANPNIVTSWKEALAFCEESPIGGHTDWKLPDVKELDTIVDRTRTTPPFINDLFNAESTSYWTSTTDISFPPGAWRIHFESGNVMPYMYKVWFMDPAEDPGYVRCMRIP